MLVLSRKLGERIFLSDGEKNIVITVVQVKGDKIRLGISSPRSVTIHREEVYREIHGDANADHFSRDADR